MEITIPAGRTLRIRNACGTVIRVVEGTGWITEENDPEDYALGTGERRMIGTAGLTLAHALEPVRIEISAYAFVELGLGYREYAATVFLEQMRRRMQAWNRRFRALLGIPTIPMPTPSRLASGLKRSMP